MIGIKDDGTPEGIPISQVFNSMNFLFKMVEIINARIKNIRIYRGIQKDTYIFTARIHIPDYKPKQLLSI